MTKPTLTNSAVETLTGGLLKRACLLAATSAAIVCAPARGPAHYAQTLAQRPTAATPQTTGRPTAPERPSDFFEQLGAPFAGRKLARAKAPMVGLATSANVVQPCSGAESSARVVVTASGFDPERRRLSYRWRASGGSIVGSGERVTWDLSGVAPGRYGVSVSLEVAGDYPSKLAGKEAHVVVRACGQPPHAACPTISLCCRTSVTAGEPAAFEATLKGGPPNVRPTYVWSVSAGRIVSGNGTQAIGVDTSGLGGQTLLAVFEPRGYGASCRSSCLTSVLRAPPTPTPTPDIPTPTPTPHIGVVVTPTPTPTPAPAASPTPEPSPTATPWRPPAAITIHHTPPTRPALPPREARRYAMLFLILAATAAAAYAGLKRRGKVFTAARGGGRKVYAAAAAAAATGAAAAAAAGKTDKEGDEVHCTVFAPNECAPGSSFLVQAFAHLPEQAPLLLEMANDSDEDAEQRGSEELSQRIERGQELVFALHMPGLEVDEPVQSLVWDGEPESVQFGVTIPETGKPNRSLIGTVTISRESVPVARVKFKFKICDAAEGAGDGEHAEMRLPSQGFARYRRAFISYASEDRAEVLKRVQMLKTMNIELFQDLLSLEPGDRWKRELYKHIDESDVIFLFWSSAAKKSRWVRRELQYALARKAGNDAALPEITPVILEGPPIVPPPDYLEDVHFNDMILYLIGAEQAARAARKPVSATRVKANRRKARAAAGKARVRKGAGRQISAE